MQKQFTFDIKCSSESSYWIYSLIIFVLQTIKSKMKSIMSRHERNAVSRFDEAAEEK